ncbi:MAG: Nif3-like dinuclear metal center hexameric protein [Clostridia bacterium]|nr:Nif3-like dinuclear metal center hexameric protein [Clostridia bacterium]
MTVEEVLTLLEESVAPVKLSDDFCAKYKMYDNSGIIINCGQPVTGVLFSLDLSEAAAERAVWLGYNLIVTHHPAIYGGISRFDLTSSAQARALATCLKQGVSVISMHLNFDAAEHGIDCQLMQGLGGKQAKTLCEIQGGGYGRVYSVPSQTLHQFIQNVKTTFSTERALCFGEPDRTIGKVASFCGAGCDDNAIAFAKQNGVDVLVSSDIKHHQITELVESNIAVVQLTHYSAECYGFNKIYQSVKPKTDLPSSIFIDPRMM